MNKTHTHSDARLNGIREFPGSYVGPMSDIFSGIHCTVSKQVTTASCHYF
jgi:hypothetical protein